jgi:hypothetical protein
VYYLFAICPNSASCECEFLALDWLFHKHCLNLDLEILESMSKMILYWKPNSKTELGFYEIDQKKKTQLSDEEINIRIAEAFAEMDEEENSVKLSRLTKNSVVIPEDNCRVIIESLWIDKLVDLSYRLITDKIGNIPMDIIDDSDENNMRDDDVNDGGAGMRIGEDDFDYDINDLTGVNNVEDDDGNDGNDIIGVDDVGDDNGNE